jgi:hypothetical protein
MPGYLSMAENIKADKFPSGVIGFFLTCLPVVGTSCKNTIRLVIQAHDAGKKYPTVLLRKLAIIVSRRTSSIGLILL